VTSRSWIVWVVLFSALAALVAIEIPTLALLLAFAAVVALALFVAPKLAVSSLAVFLLLQSALVNFVGGQATSLGLALQRLDKWMIVAATLRIAVFFGWRDIQVDLRRWVVFVCAFLGAGILSAAFAHVPMATSLLGAFLAAKFSAFLLLALTIKWEDRDAAHIVRAALILGPLLLGVGILFLVLPPEVSRLFIDPSADPSADVQEFLARGGLQSMHGPFVNPGLFGWAMAVVGCYAIAQLATRRSSLGVGGLLSSVLGIVASLRRKPLVALPVAVLSYAFSARTRRQRLGLLALLVVLIGGVGLIGRDRVRTVVENTMTSYLDPYSPTTARSLLYLTGWKIAEEHFPFGAGFGRFGGYVSQIHYSPLYDQYGLSGVYGLSRERPMYLQDTYWPHIVGEAGVLGALVLLAFLFELWRRSIRVASSSLKPHVRALAAGASMVLVEGIVESVATPVFEVSLLAYTIAIPLGITLVLGGQRNERSNLPGTGGLEPSVAESP
jgi:hypothetical protein